MKHKVNVSKILVRKDKVYLSYEIITHLNLSPGERLSIEREKDKAFLKIHHQSGSSGTKLKVENRNGLVGFFIKLKNHLPERCYIFNGNVGREDSQGNYLSPLRAVTL